MKIPSLFPLLALLIPGSLWAQGVAPSPSPAFSEETLAILQDRRQRDRLAEIEAALQIKLEADAQRVVDSILAEANAAAIISETKAGARLRAEEAGRTELARAESVAFLSRRQRSEVALAEAPESFRSRLVLEGSAPEGGSC